MTACKDIMGFHPLFIEVLVATKEKTSYTGLAEITSFHPLFIEVLVATPIPIGGCCGEGNKEFPSSFH
jgi:hypothetical protein